MADLPLEEFLLAIDPDRCGANGGAAGALAHAEQLFEKIAEQPGTRLPGERRAEARLKTPTEGITVVPVLWDKLVELRG